jgi:ABC-type phosphate/phosphonate transport system substrate-binding protein
VTHVCGWPFAAVHRNDMELVGAFDLDLPEAEDGRYRSVLLSPDPTPADAIDPAATHAVANSADSLSGWLSLLAATVGTRERWPGTVTYTSSHHDSVRALAEGEADLACIDSWSLALITHDEPELLRGLHRVGLGPAVPTPPVTVRKSVDAHRIDELRTAFGDALADPATARARAALRILGAAANTLDDYVATLTLGPST